VRVIAQVEPQRFGKLPQLRRKLHKLIVA
jgi:hypothetical protein